MCLIKDPPRVTQGFPGAIIRRRSVSEDPGFLSGPDGRHDDTMVTLPSKQTADMSGGEPTAPQIILQVIQPQHESAELRRVGDRRRNCPAVNWANKHVITQAGGDYLKRCPGLTGGGIPNQQDQRRTPPLGQPARTTRQVPRDSRS
jgi:hypothetical protein